MNLNNSEILIGCLSKLEDPRAKYNQKHKFLDIVVIENSNILYESNNGKISLLVKFLLVIKLKHVKKIFAIYMLK